jgi:hypothetical protein
VLQGLGKCSNLLLLLLLLLLLGCHCVFECCWREVIE